MLYFILGAIIEFGISIKTLFTQIFIGTDIEYVTGMDMIPSNDCSAKLN